MSPLWQHHWHYVHWQHSSSPRNKTYKIQVITTFYYLVFSKNILLIFCFGILLFYAKLACSNFLHDCPYLVSSCTIVGTTFIVINAQCLCSFSVSQFYAAAAGVPNYETVFRYCSVAESGSCVEQFLKQLGYWQWIVNNPHVDLFALDHCLFKLRNWCSTSLRRTVTGHNYW